MKEQDMGLYFEAGGKLERRWEKAFDDGNGKYYGCSILWMGGKANISLSKEAYEGLPPDGGYVSIEGDINVFDGKLKLKGTKSEHAGSSALDDAAKAPSRRAA